MKPKLSKQAPNAAESELAAMRDIQRRSFVTAAYSVTNIICGVVENEIGQPETGVAHLCITSFSISDL